MGVPNQGKPNACGKIGDPQMMQAAIRKQLTPIAKQYPATIAWSTGNIAQGGTMISRNMLHGRRKALAWRLRPDARNDSAVAHLPAGLTALVTSFAAAKTAS